MINIPILVNYASHVKATHLSVYWKTEGSNNRQR
jgi:hypothetical protein